MISLIKTQEYSAIVKGHKHTVKVLNKDIAVEFFQDIDSSIRVEDIKRVPNGTSKAAMSIESVGEAFPTHTNL